MMNLKQIIWLSFIFIICGCATVPLTGRKQMVFISSAELFTVGVDNYKQIISQSKISKDRERTMLVRSVGEKIAASAEDFLIENKLADKIRYFQWEFNLIEDDAVVNAFCLPGGKIAVYTGILPYTEDEAGLAVVIAHEVAHALANHGGERMSQLMVAQFGSNVVSRAIATEGEKTKQFLMLAYGVGMNLGVVLPYSRMHEKEADHIGLMVMARAGYDPRTAVKFWERMSSIGQRAPEFLSTHPAPETRIEEIRSELPEALSYYENRVN